MAHTPRHDPPPPPDDEGTLSGLRDVPSLPLRVGRHVTAWLLWHTARVSLLEDAPAPADLDRTARA